MTPVVFTPGDFGLMASDVSELDGGDAPTNARILRSVLEGEVSARRDAALANAAATLMVAGLRKLPPRELPWRPGRSTRDRPGQCSTR